MKSEQPAKKKPPFANLKDKRTWKLVSIEKATNPSNGIHMIYKDHYWVVTRKDQVIYFIWQRPASPQCHAREDVANSFLKGFDRCTVKQLPYVFLPVNPQDYCD